MEEEEEEDRGEGRFNQKKILLEGFGYFLEHTLLLIKNLSLTITRLMTGEKYMKIS